MELFVGIGLLIAFWVASFNFKAHAEGADAGVLAGRASALFYLFRWRRPCCCSYRLWGICDGASRTSPSPCGGRWRLSSAALADMVLILCLVKLILPFLPRDMGIVSQIIAPELRGVGAFRGAFDAVLGGVRDPSWRCDAGAGGARPRVEGPHGPAAVAWAAGGAGCEQALVFLG